MTRIRLKTRAILAYLSAVCFGTVVFGLYFLLSPSLPPSKSRNGIERAAKDSWSALKGRRALPSLLRFRNEGRKPDIALLLREDNGVQLMEKPGQDKAQEQQQHVLHPPHTEVVLPTKAQLQNMSWEELSNLYHSYTQQIQVTCASIERLGKITDGGWEVCEDSPYKPVAPCLVYSFGVGEDFSFDDAVAKRYGCEVHSFDPSMKIGDHQRPSSVQFHSLGLADFSGKTSDGWKMSTLPEIRQTLGQAEKPLSLLKMDIEEWEWKVLPSLLAGGHLSDTKQLLMELHQCDGCSQYNPDRIDKEPPRERYVTALGILKDLYDIGFRIFWRHQNQACRYLSKFGLSQRSACCEIHMVQTGQGTN